MNYQRFGSRVGGQRERIILLCDTSGSMSSEDYKPSRLAACQQAFHALLDLKLANAPQDEVGLVEFESAARLVCPPVVVGEGIDTLRQKVDGLSIGGGTDLVAGMEKATKAATSKRGGATGVGRLFGGLLLEPPSQPMSSFVPRIICCTDGGFQSLDAARKTAASAQDRGVVVDVIGIAGSRSSFGFYEEHCREIASDDPTSPCGKRYVFVKDTEQLVHEFRTRAHLIRRA